MTLLHVYNYLMESYVKAGELENWYDNGCEIIEDKLAVELYKERQIEYARINSSRV